MDYRQKPFYYKGHKIHYFRYENGNSPVIICLHGLNLDGRIFATKSMRKLLANKTILALDLPGYGKSGFWPKVNFTEIEALITAFANSLNLKYFELCGFCLGGIFALDYAIRNPTRVTKLYLIDTMIYLPFWLNFCSTNFFGFLYNYFSKNKFWISLLDIFPTFKGLKRIKSLALIHTVWDKQVNTFYLRLMREYQKFNHIERSRRITCPTELYYSEKAFRNIKKTNQKLHLAIPKSSLHLLQNNGHFSLVT
ncbi:MAG: alpha/beta fold hydrolase [Desulfitobacteriia bacterium]